LGKLNKAPAIAGMFSFHVINDTPSSCSRSENGNGNMAVKLRTFFVTNTTFSIVKASNFNYFLLIIIHFITSSNLKLLYT
jgi:hypothetical protein